MAIHFHVRFFLKCCKVFPANSPDVFEGQLLADVKTTVLQNVSEGRTIDNFRHRCQFIKFGDYTTSWGEENIQKL